MIEPEKLNAALDLISKGITRPTKIAKAMGISYRSYCAWMVKSNSGDERFLVTYNGEEMQWARAITLATKLALFELRGMLLQEGIFGYGEIQTKDGNVVWAYDPAAAAIDDPDLRELLGYRRDALLEMDGKLVPVTIKRKAPFAQQIRLLEAAFADLRPSQTINQNVAVNGSVGIGFAKPVDYSKGPPPIPPPPPRPELPAPIDAEFNEVEDFLGPDPRPALEPGAAPININLAPVINVQAEPDEYVQPSAPSRPPETERVIRDTPTEREMSPKQDGILKPLPQAEGPGLAYDAPPPRAARTALEQNLFDELERARARKAQL